MQLLLFAIVSGVTMNDADGDALNPGGEMSTMSTPDACIPMKSMMAPAMASTSPFSSASARMAGLSPRTTVLAVDGIEAEFLEHDRDGRQVAVGHEAEGAVGDLLHRRGTVGQGHDALGGHVPVVVDHHQIRAGVDRLHDLGSASRGDVGLAVLHERGLGELTTGEEVHLDPLLGEVPELVAHQQRPEDDRLGDRLEEIDGAALGGRRTVLRITLGVALGSIGAGSVIAGGIVAGVVVTAGCRKQCERSDQGQKPSDTGHVVSSRRWSEISSVAAPRFRAWRAAARWLRFVSRSSRCQNTTHRSTSSINP